MNDTVDEKFTLPINDHVGLRKHTVTGLHLLPSYFREFVGKNPTRKYDTSQHGVRLQAFKKMSNHPSGAEQRNNGTAHLLRIDQLFHCDKIQPTKQCILLTYLDYFKDSHSTRHPTHISN